MEDLPTENIFPITPFVQITSPSCLPINFSSPRQLHKPQRARRCPIYHFYYSDVSEHLQLSFSRVGNVTLTSNNHLLNLSPERKLEALSYDIFTISGRFYFQSEGKQIYRLESPLKKEKRAYLSQITQNGISMNSFWLCGDKKSIHSLRAEMWKCSPTQKGMLFCRTSRRITRKMLCVNGESRLCFGALSGGKCTYSVNYLRLSSFWEFISNVISKVRVNRLDTRNLWWRNLPIKFYGYIFMPESVYNLTEQRPTQVFFFFLLIRYIIAFAYQFIEP